MTSRAARPYLPIAVVAAGAMLAALAGPALAQDRFVAPLPADAEMTIRKDIEYARAAEAPLRFDIYRPTLQARRDPVPVVIMMNGIGADWMRGHVQYAGWGRYVTTRGFAGVTMDSTPATAAQNFDQLVSYLDAHAADLGVDTSRIVVWACSANVTAGFPLVEDPARPRIVAAVMYYGAGPVEDVARFRLDVPVLMMRAGRDNPGLNRNIDRMAARASAANAPVTLVNYPGGQHGFDIRDDNELSRALMTQTLDFMSAAVEPRTIAARRGGLILARASAALFAEDWPGALAAFEALAREEPQNAEIQQRLGETLLATGDTRRAVAALERSVELGSPNRGLITFALVRAHTRAGDIDSAVAALERLQPFLRFFGKALREEPEFAPLRADRRFAALGGGTIR